MLLVKNRYTTVKSKGIVLDQKRIHNNVGNSSEPYDEPRVMRMDVVIIKGASVNEQGIGSGAKEDQRAGSCRLY